MYEGRASWTRKSINTSTGQIIRYIADPNSKMWNEPSSCQGNYVQITDWNKTNMFERIFKFDGQDPEQSPLVSDFIKTSHSDLRGHQKVYSMPFFDAGNQLDHELLQRIRFGMGSGGRLQLALRTRQESPPLAEILEAPWSRRALAFAVTIPFTT